MSNETLKVSHLVDYTPDNDDPGFDGIVASRLLAKAVIAQAAKIDVLTAKLNVLGAKLNVLTAKLNADAGVTDTNYAIDFAIDYAVNFESTVTATEHTEG